ncbi:MAG: family serine peptidase [Bacteroidetes bacterium]|nr:family serine peptidase [Bacteroidota bacterium]
MSKKIILSAIVLLLSAFAFKSKAQTKYFVKFKDKNGTPYSVSSPTAFLTPLSVHRRNWFGIPVDQTDLPVTPAYINQIEAINGVTCLYASKWINGVMVTVTSTSIVATINSFSFVASSAPVNRVKLQPVDVQQQNVSHFKTAAVSSATSNYGGSYWQTKQLNLDCLHGQGFRGQGMVIAVLDAGFQGVNTNPVFDSLFARGGVLGTRDFVAGGTSVYEDDAHGAAVLSCMAAIKPGVIMGSAPRAGYWLLRTEDNASPNPQNETPSEEYNWIRGAEFADSVGADVLNTSLGYSTFNKPVYDHTFSQLDGKTIDMSKAATMAARKGMLVVNSAGNGNGSSWPKISFPADADSICTVGAIDSLSQMASFSSLGPTADGRIKPDLVARGLGSWVSFPGGNCGQSNGTSFSSPILAGAMTCFWQAHKTWNNIKILDTLRKTASNAATPDNQRGWGTPNMCSIPVGIKEIDSHKNQLMVSPNPFNSFFTIQLQNYPSAPTVIEIYNAIGVLVKTIPVVENQIHYSCDMPEAAPGIYFVRMNGREGASVKKILKH